MKKIFALIIVLFSLNACQTIVAGTVATAGAVVSQERSVGSAVDDIGIQAQIKHLYLQKNAQDLLAGVDVEVIEGRVHLTGKVKTPETRVDAVRLAWQPKGVKEVTNDIQIVGEEKLGNIMNDKWIDAQLDSKLIVTSGVRSLNYSTEVVNGVVYLMGIARSPEELDKVTQIASTIKGVKKVVSHVRMKDDPSRVQ